MEYTYIFFRRIRAINQLMDGAPVIRQSSTVAGTSGASHSMSFGWLAWVESCPRVSDLYDQLPERHRKTAVATSDTRAQNQRQ